MNNQATDISARLLATENLNVVRQAVATASFDIKSRVLTLPMWKDMTPEIEDMLVGHEVGHALYTSPDKYLKPIKENPKMMSYLNIVEDVRIEKLIKRKYPGLRKRMNEGYRQLNERDFFGISKIPVDDILLIDKINLYFKAGFQCGVTFTPDEKQFVNRAERIETVEDVIQLAEDIYKYAKEKADEKNQQKKNMPVPAEDEDGEEGDGDYEDYDDQSEGLDDPEADKDKGEAAPGGGHGGRTSAKAEDFEDDEIDAKTDKAFQDNLNELADQSTVYKYHGIVECGFDPIVPYKTILSDLKFDFDENSIASWYKNNVYGELTRDEWLANFNLEIQKFKADSTSSVNYLVKEFELKKSAQQHKRSQISKIGSLDMRKVYAYQIQDDLFKRVTSLPTGKNHGMVFLLDWSGSMDHVIMDTLKQVINLCMFCNKVQIPYEVYAFSSNYKETREEWNVRSERIRSTRDECQAKKISVIENKNGFSLLQLFSHKMSMTEFNSMVKKVLDPRVFWHNDYALGGTPLNESLLWIYQNLGDFIKANRIEKMNFITLTDGAGCNLTATEHLSSTTYVSGVGHVNVKHFIRDEITKKTYEFSCDSTQQTETLIKMIKDRYDLRVVGFFVCRNRSTDLGYAIHNNIYGYKGSVSDMISSMRQSFKKDGFYSLKGTGRDDLFIIPSESTKISEDQLTVTTNMNSKSLSKSLGKFLNVKKTSRVLLSRFINYIA